MTNTLTPEQREKYLQSPNSCPHCGSKDIEGHSHNYEGNYITQDISCLKCGAQWTDIYTLHNVEGKLSTDTALEL